MLPPLLTATPPQSFCLVTEMKILPCLVFTLVGYPDVLRCPLFCEGQGHLWYLVRPYSQSLITVDHRYCNVTHQGQKSEKGCFTFLKVVWVIHWFPVGFPKALNYCPFGLAKAFSCRSFDSYNFARVTCEINYTFTLARAKTLL